MLERCWLDGGLALAALSRASARGPLDLGAVLVKGAGQLMRPFNEISTRGSSGSRSRVGYSSSARGLPLCGGHMSRLIRSVVAISVACAAGATLAIAQTKTGATQTARGATPAAQP